MGWFKFYMCLKTVKINRLLSRIGWPQRRKSDAKAAEEWSNASGSRNFSVVAARAADMSGPDVAEGGAMASGASRAGASGRTTALSKYPSHRNHGGVPTPLAFWLEGADTRDSVRCCVTNNGNLTEVYPVIWTGHTVKISYFWVLLLTRHAFI